MIRYRFGQDDLLRTRFAIAPLMELVGVVYVLRNPDRYVLHRVGRNGPARALSGWS